MNLDTNCMLLVFLYSNLLRLGSPVPQTSIVKFVTILELKIYIEKTTWAVKGSQSIKVGNSCAMLIMPPLVNLFPQLLPISIKAPHCSSVLPVSLA